MTVTKISGSGSVPSCSFPGYPGLSLLLPTCYLMATALAGEPIPPGAFSGALTRNIS